MSKTEEQPNAQTPDLHLSPKQREILGRRLDSRAKRREAEAEAARLDSELIREGVPLNIIMKFDW
jgi:hypothetical protein